MKIQEKEFFIDKAYSKYQSKSKKDKLFLNFSLVLLIVMLAIGSIYNIGEAFGEFLYTIMN